MVLILGVFVARGGSKWSSSASRMLCSASSSVSPWLAISTSRHWATNQGPSRWMVTVKVRFMLLHLHHSSWCDETQALAHLLADTATHCQRLPRLSLIGKGAGVADLDGRV